MSDGEFSGRAAGRAAGEHIADVTRKVTGFVNDEPDRLMHLATQTGFIQPGDQRYTRFLTDKQIETFNQNMADNADLVRAHAEEYRRDQSEKAALAGDAHVKAYLDSQGLGDPQGFEAMSMIGDKAATDAYKKHQAEGWAAGGRAGFAEFGKRHNWSPDEIKQRQSGLDWRFGYHPPAPAPGPANNGATPAAPAPGPSTAPAAPPPEPGPIAGAPHEQTAAAASGAGAYSGVGAGSTLLRRGAQLAARTFSPAPGMIPRGGTPVGFDGNAPTPAIGGGGMPAMAAAPNGRPQAAGPPVTKQPGMPGAATPGDRASWLKMLAGD